MYYIGADHRGFGLKEKIRKYFEDNGISCRDLGNIKLDPEDDYVDFAIEVGKKAVSEMALGILTCGTGTGMSIAANKVSGVRAAFCFNTKQARLAVEDNNINILCLGSDLVAEEENLEIVRAFVNSQFIAEERHIRRINKIKKYESIK